MHTREVSRLEFSGTPQQVTSVASDVVGWELSYNHQKSHTGWWWNFSISEYTGYNLVYLIYLIFSPILWMAPNGVRRVEFLEFVKNLSMSLWVSSDLHIWSYIWSPGRIKLHSATRKPICRMQRNLATDHHAARICLFLPTVICVILAIRLNGTNCFT